jgi:hypothetical protein
MARTRPSRYGSRVSWIVWSLVTAVGSATTSLALKRTVEVGGLLMSSPASR